MWLVHTTDFREYLEQKSGAGLTAHVPFRLGPSTTVPFVLLREFGVDCAQHQLQPDRHGVCPFITNSSGVKLFRARYPDYPWPLTAPSPA